MNCVEYDPAYWSYSSGDEYLLYHLNLFNQSAKAYKGRANQPFQSVDLSEGVSILLISRSGDLCQRFRLLLGMKLRVTIFSLELLHFEF